MAGKKKKRPSQTFNSLAAFIRFLLENQKHLEKDEGGYLEAKLFFTDGSYATVDYTESWSSDSGTWWPEQMTIEYFEAD